MLLIFIAVKNNMKNIITKNTKILIVSFLTIYCFLFLGSNIIFARNLEVNYPGLNTNTVEQTYLPNYIKYIFNFAILVSISIASIFLVIAGIKYVTSTGKPEKIKEARSQIFSALFGIVILLSSYILLSTINPTLINLDLPVLQTFSIPPLPDFPPPASPNYPNFLWRIAEIADSVKKTINNPDKGIIKTANNIDSYVLNCDCQNTHPSCVCIATGDTNLKTNETYYINGQCNAQYCYSQKPEEPCPDNNAIRIEQQKIIALLSEIFYYRNRATSENEDFSARIKAIEKDVSFYNEQIKKQPEKEILDGLIQKRDNLISQKSLYQDLQKNLANLSIFINEFEPLITGEKGVSKLPNDCLKGVKEKCQGKCEGGCHNEKKCAPVSCEGGNPCPVEEIKKRIQEMDPLKEKISKVCDNIIEIIEKIIKL